MLVPYLLGLGWLWRSSRVGFVQHLPFLWALLLLFIFCWVGPAWLFASNLMEVAGLAYGSKFAAACWVYAGGVSAFVGGYIAICFWKQREHNAPRLLPPAPTALQAGCVWAIGLGLTLYSFHASGAPVWDVFDFSDKRANLVLYSGHINKYFENGSDFLLGASVALGGLGIGVGLATVPLVALLAISFLLFFMMGFRYRIVLLLLGLATTFYLRRKEKVSWWKAVLLVCCLGYVVAFSTVNRYWIATRNWHQISPSVAGFDLGLLVHETNNCQTFMTMLACRQQTGTGPDYGVSSLGFLFLRPIPRFLWPDGKKPFPPLLAEMRSCYDRTIEGKKTNPALSHLEEYYLGGGWVGVLLGMSVLSLFCWWLGQVGAHAKRLSCYWRQLACGLGIGLLFQWQSRGYLPQVAELASVLVLPLLLLYFWALYANRNRARPRQDRPL